MPGDGPAAEYLGLPTKQIRSKPSANILQNFDIITSFKLVLLPLKNQHF